jgi:transcription-repair coupling factor (superfamily II helicase)
MTAVGFQLYTSMLAEAIERQRGGRVKAAERQQPLISLPLDAYIPSEYVQDENQRLRLYQRLASLDTVEEVADLEAEIRDRFGPVPDPVRAVLATVRIRIKAAHLGIASVKLDPTLLTISGTPLTLYDRPSLYTRYGMAARIDRGILRIPAGRLSRQPGAEVEEILDRALKLAQQAGAPPAPAPATASHR